MRGNGYGLQTSFRKGFQNNVWYFIPSWQKNIKENITRIYMRKQTQNNSQGNIKFYTFNDYYELNRFYSKVISNKA